MLKLSACFGIWNHIEHGFGQIDARSDPNGTRVGAKQRSSPLVLIEQSANGEINDLCLVSARELFRS